MAAPKRRFTHPALKTVGQLRPVDVQLRSGGGGGGGGGGSLLQHLRSHVPVPETWLAWLVSLCWMFPFIQHTPPVNVQYLLRPMHIGNG
jgi:hypothetical protein